MQRSIRPCTQLRRMAIMIYCMCIEMTDNRRFLTEYKNQPPEAIEVEDDEGDTPLFFCDKEETAKFLVEELGANAKHKNHAGLTAAENALVNDLEDVARYLASVTGATLPSRAELLLRTGEEDEDEETENAALEARLTEVPESDAEGVSDEQVDELMQRVEEIMRNADETGADPTEQLREVVGAGIMRQIMEGYQRD